MKEALKKLEKVLEEEEVEWEVGREAIHKTDMKNYLREEDYATEITTVTHSKDVETFLSCKECYSEKLEDWDREFSFTVNCRCPENGESCEGCHQSGVILCEACDQNRCIGCKKLLKAFENEKCRKCKNK